MRATMVLLVLLCMGWPALAHDDEFGLRHCYSGHCPQDTLVFGVVTSVDAKTYTVVVRKVLRTIKGDVAPGMRVRLVNPGRQRPSCLYQEPRVNGGVLVSFLKKGTGPYRPYYQVRSTTTDWRKMTVEGYERSDFAENIERLVRSGGTAYGFFGPDRDNYIVTRDGEMKRLATGTELDRGTYLPKAPASPHAGAKPQPGRAGTRREAAGRGGATDCAAQEARRPGVRAARRAGRSGSASAASR